MATVYLQMATVYLQMGENPEPLLASSVPYLQTYSLAVVHNVLAREVDSNRGPTILGELVPGVSSEEVGFTHARVTNQYN